MQDDLNIPENNPENPSPKKRGRTTRATTKKATTKRVRRTKKEDSQNVKEETPQNYDLGLDDNNSQTEEPDAPVYVSIERDEDTPMSFSTSDEDLVQDNYRDDYEEDDFVILKTESDSYDVAASMEEQIEEDFEPKQNQQNNRRQNDRNNRNNRNNNQRNQNNRKQDGDKQNQQNDRNNRNNRNNNQRNQNNQQNQRNQNNRNNNQQNGRQAKQNQQSNRQQATKVAPKPSWQNPKDKGETSLDIGELQNWQTLKSIDETKAYLLENFDRVNIVEFADYYSLNTKELVEKLSGEELPFSIKNQSKYTILTKLFEHFGKQRRLIRVEGILDLFEKSYGGVLCFARDNFQLKRFCPWISPKLIEEYGLKRGHSVSVLCCPPREGEGEKCLIALEVECIMGKSPVDLKDITPFNDLVAYYPTERMIMEMTPPREWDNLSMRTVDLLTPIGLGQRALIVAPPRTGKTVLMQGMAKSIRENTPQANVIILLVDERPEEVTDFKRNVDAMVIASTFDQDAESHVHACEMVIALARRLVEMGEDVVILLDSITRMARAYNTMMPSSGKIMSGGVESNALQKPKRFFGSARNVEGGGSLTIIGTALVETGSKMDEVIFEEFKGTGNMEINLDRSLVDKRIYPAINIEKSGTRKEELLYHPDEMQKIYALRRAMKAVPNTEAMEMLVQRLKKTRTNIEFLMGLNR